MTNLQLRRAQLLPILLQRCDVVQAKANSCWNIFDLFYPSRYRGGCWLDNRTMDIINNKLVCNVHDTEVPW